MTLITSVREKNSSLGPTVIVISATLTKTVHELTWSYLSDYILMLFGKLYRLEKALQEHGERKKLKNWENWTIRIKELMGDCQDNLADLKSKEEPKDGRELEEQIILANVRSVICCLSVFLCFLYRDTVFICLFV